MPAKSSIGASAVQLVGAAGTLCINGVNLRADPANTGTVYIGYSNAVTAGSADATDGLPLNAGDTLYLPATKIAAKDLSNIWLIGSASGQRVFYDTDIHYTISAGSSNVTSHPALAAGEAHVGEVGRRVAVASANFTRPADTNAYASGDLVANSITAASVVPMSFTAARVALGNGQVRRARLKKSTTTVTAASFRLHLYGTDPSLSTGIANGDNGVWSTKQAGYLGSIVLDMTASTGRAFSDAAEAIGTPDTGSEICFKLAAGTTIYGLLEARGAYSPGNAEVFTVELEIFQN